MHLPREDRLGRDAKRAGGVDSEKKPRPRAAGGEQEYTLGRSASVSAVSPPIEVMMKSAMMRPKPERKWKEIIVMRPLLGDWKRKETNEGVCARGTSQRGRCEPIC